MRDSLGQLIEATYCNQKLYLHLGMHALELRQLRDLELRELRALELR